MPLSKWKNNTKVEGDRLRLDEGLSSSVEARSSIVHVNISQYLKS
jgi:hypothetical protein